MMSTSTQHAPERLHEFFVPDALDFTRLCLCIHQYDGKTGGVVVLHKETCAIRYTPQPADEVAANEETLPEQVGLVVGGARRRVDRAALAANARELLVLIGEDPEREGLRDTPTRVAKAWAEFVEYEAGTLDTVFTHDTDQLVLVAGIRVWTLCEHHLHPFYVDLAMAYLPAGNVIGLSKLARIAHSYAHRLNLQEALVADIAKAIQHVTGSEHVAVMGIGEHLCMTMRGIKAPGKMLSTKLSGAFRESDAARAEFYQLARLAGMEAHHAR